MGPAPEHDYYAILGISDSSTMAEVKVAYYRKALQLHPDKNLEKATATAAFQLLGKAYETMSDPSQRQKYDRKRRLRGNQHAVGRSDAEKSEPSPEERRQARLRLLLKLRNKYFEQMWGLRDRQDILGQGLMELRLQQYKETQTEDPEAECKRQARQPAVDSKQDELRRIFAALSKCQKDLMDTNDKIFATERSFGGARGSAEKNEEAWKEAQEDKRERRRKHVRKRARQEEQKNKEQATKG